MNAKNKHGIGTLNPSAGLEGAYLHVNDPAIYLLLNAWTTLEGPSHAPTCGQAPAAPKKLPTAGTALTRPVSGLLIVRVDESCGRLWGHRYKTRMSFRPNSRSCPGKHWLKIHAQPALDHWRICAGRDLVGFNINRSRGIFALTPTGRQRGLTGQSS